MRSCVFLPSLETGSTVEPHADAEAIVQAAGQGLRLGLGPKAFITLEGRTLLERAVETMLAVCARAIVAVPSDQTSRAQHLVGGGRVSVIAGGATRAATLRLLVRASSAPWLLLHDAVRPFVTVALARQVLAAARAHGAAAAVCANDDFVYARDGGLRAHPHEVVAVQKPIAFARDALLRGFAADDRSGPLAAPSVLQLLALAGQDVAFVPAGAGNLKISTADDYALAQRIARS